MYKLIDPSICLFFCVLLKFISAKLPAWSYTPFLPLMITSTLSALLLPSIFRYFLVVVSVWRSWRDPRLARLALSRSLLATGEVWLVWLSVRFFMTFLIVILLFTHLLGTDTVGYRMIPEFYCCFRAKIIVVGVLLI